MTKPGPSGGGGGDRSPYSHRHWLTQSLSDTDIHTNKTTLTHTAHTLTHRETLPTHTLITLHTAPPPHTHTHTRDTAPPPPPPPQTHKWHCPLHTHTLSDIQLMTLTHTRADWWHTDTLTYHFSDSAALTHCDTLIRWHAYTQVASESIRPLPLTQWHPPWLTTHTHSHTLTRRGLTLTMTDGHARVCACTYMQLLNGTITQPHYSFSQRGPARPTPAAATSATPLELTLSGQSVSLVNLSRRPRLKTTVQSVDMLILSV